MRTTAQARSAALARRWLVCGLVSACLAACSENGAALDPDLEPDPTPADPVPLEAGSTLGEEAFPAGNTASGGQGDAVGGVGCIEEVAVHYHAHLSLFVEGERIAVPAAVGIVDPVIVDGFTESGSCFYWLHTHDATGLIHIEPPAPMDLTLGQFFEVWGQPLSDGDVAGFDGELSVFVDGERYTGDVRGIVLASRQHISLQIGRPLAPPPMYTFQR